MAKRIYPLPGSRGLLFNGARARSFMLGPLQPASLAGKASMAPPYAQGWTVPGFSRLGLKPVQPLKGPGPIDNPPPAVLPGNDYTGP